MEWKTRRGGAVCAAFLGTALGMLAPGHAHAAAPLADLDLMAMGGNMAAFSPPLLGIGPSTGVYTLSANCALVIGGGSVPTFIDVPPDEGGLQGTCRSVSGSGIFTSLSCGTGVTTGNLSVTEPAGDATSLAYTMVFVAGVGVVGGTWADDGGSGAAAGVAVIVPPSLTDCTGVITQYNFTAVLAAAY